MIGKNNKILWKIFLIIILFWGIFLLSDCTYHNQPLKSTNTIKPLTSTREPVQSEITMSPEGSTQIRETFTKYELNAFTLSPSPTKTANEEVTTTPTPDLRVSPDEWQSWPIVPNRVSAKMKEVYQNGLRNGNNPRSFSKIGDCQNVTSAFLGIYDKKSGYSFSSDFAYLKDTINYFSGSFGRESQSVRGGFNVASVLSTMWADRQACLKGETPLDCEFRLWKPSLVIISMEAWFPGRTAEIYEKYLRQIVEYAISHGAVPILATKADNTEGNQSINSTIVKIAYEYDVPLWNFWLAVQPLEDHGIDWARDSDGFHITVEAWNKRSFTALQAIDAVTKLLNIKEVVQDNLEPSTPTRTLVPSPTPLHIQAIITPLPYIQETQQVGIHPSFKGSLLFSFAQRVEGIEVFPGLYQSRLVENTINRITDAGYRLEAISLENYQLLISQKNELFSVQIDGKALKQISKHFIPLTVSSAYWLSGTQKVIYFGEAQKKKSIFLIDTTNLQERQLPGDFNQLSKLIPSPEIQYFVWEKKNCSESNCLTTICVTYFDGSSTSELIDIQNPLYAPKGDKWVYTTKVDKDKNRLYLSEKNKNRPKLLLETGGFYEYSSWSPDGSKLFVIQTSQSGYSGRILDRKYWILDFENQVNRQLNVQLGSFSLAVWSPDNQIIALFGIVHQNDESNLLIQFFDIQKRRMIRDQLFNIPGINHEIFLENVIWIPDD
jgi:hypothetical protein